MTAAEQLSLSPAAADMKTVDTIELSTAEQMRITLSSSRYLLLLLLAPLLLLQTFAPFLPCILLLLLLFLLLPSCPASCLPPGPWGLPWLGFLPWLDPEAPHETLTELVAKYGRVYTLWMGQVGGWVTVWGGMARSTCLFTRIESLAWSLQGF